MKYLFSEWEKVAGRIQKSPHVFLFFDYDGTLTPIVSRPELANFPRSIKSLIKRIQKNPKFTVAIISGRSLQDIKRRVGLKGIIYAGNHGLEIAKGSGRSLKVAPSSTRPLLKKIQLLLQRQLRHIRGVKIEDKGCTLSVHYRLAEPRKRLLVKKLFAGVVRPYHLSKKINVSLGKMVCEVRPGIEWHKGKAVLHLVSGRKGTLPLYVGDDVTDQDAFRAIKGKGISVFIGRPKGIIKADYFLNGSGDVERFMERLSEI